MTTEVHRASDWGPARPTPHAEVAASGRAGRGAMARAGGRDSTRGQCEPLGGEYLPALRPGFVGRPMAAATRTGGGHHRALRRRLCATSVKATERIAGGRNCPTDEGRPLGIGLQEQVSNHLRRLWSKAMVVSTGGKGLERTRS